MKKNPGSPEEPEQMDLFPRDAASETTANPAGDAVAPMRTGKILPVELNSDKERDCPTCGNVMVWYEGRWYCRNCNYNSLPAALKEPAKKESGFTIERSSEHARWITLTADFIRRRVMEYMMGTLEILKKEEEKFAKTEGPHMLCEQCKKLLSVGDKAVRYTYNVMGPEGNDVPWEVILCSEECQRKESNWARGQRETKRREIFGY